MGAAEEEIKRLIVYLGLQADEFEDAQARVVQKTEELREIETQLTEVERERQQTLDEVNRCQQEYNTMMEEGRMILLGNRTESERYADYVEHLNDLREAGAIDQETLNRETNDYIEANYGATESLQEVNAEISIMGNGTRGLIMGIGRWTGQTRLIMGVYASLRPLLSGTAMSLAGVAGAAATVGFIIYKLMKNFQVAADEVFKLNVNLDNLKYKLQLGGMEQGKAIERTLELLKQAKAGTLDRGGYHELAQLVAQLKSRWGDFGLEVDEVNGKIKETGVQMEAALRYANQEEYVRGLAMGAREAQKTIAEIERYKARIDQLVQEQEAAMGDTTFVPHMDKVRAELRRVATQQVNKEMLDDPKMKGKTASGLDEYLDEMKEKYRAALKEIENAAPPNMLERALGVASGRMPESAMTRGVTGFMSYLPKSVKQAVDLTMNYFNRLRTEGVGAVKPIMQELKDSYQGWAQDVADYARKQGDLATKGKDYVTGLKEQIYVLQKQKEAMDFSTEAAMLYQLQAQGVKNVNEEEVRALWDTLRPLEAFAAKQKELEKDKKDMAETTVQSIDAAASGSAEFFDRIQRQASNVRGMQQEFASTWSTRDPRNSTPTTPAAAAATNPLFKPLIDLLALARRHWSGDVVVIEPVGLEES